MKDKIAKRIIAQRGWFQLIATLLANNWLTAPLTKGIPCLGFNCYACPLAAVACPIGSLQYFAGTHQIPWYLLGVLGLVGTLGGRLACGWLCPFGWLQELLFKLPLPKRAMHPRPRAPWQILIPIGAVYLLGLWLVLALAHQINMLLAAYLLVGMALFIWLDAGRAFALGGVVLIVAWITREPWFCKLCPAGTLEGGIPQVLLNADLRAWIGPLFWLKIGLLILLLGWAIIVKRPFCRWLCPLGTIWSPFNRLSTLYLSVDEQTCIRCDRCRQVCPVDIRIYQDANAPTCIRCMQCIRVCPVDCIHLCKR